ncbi:MAG: RDD family protein [Halioglobus sp.]
MLYDLLLVVAVVGVVNAAALGIQVKLLDSADHALNPHLAQALIVTSVYGFFILFWIKSGQTLGMQAWRIKLVTFEGEPPNLRHALVRCLAATLSAACLGLGYLWCLFDSRGRYWHDYLSATELILLPKKERTSA